MPSIEFLGHASFLITEGDTRVAIDPWLKNNPVAKRSIDELECDHIVVTHGHFDHFEDVPAIAKRTGAMIHAPFEIHAYMQELGHEKSQPINPGGCIETEFGFVAMVPAVHSSSFEGRYMGAACGTVVKIGGKVIYHSGDTALFSDMKLIGERYKPDVALISAGNRFTMDPAEAATAAEWIGAKTAVPFHWGTFDALAQDVDAFTPKGVEVKLMESGQVWVL